MTEQTFETDATFSRINIKIPRYAVDQVNTAQNCCPSGIQYSFLPMIQVFLLSTKTLTGTHQRFWMYGTRLTAQGRPKVSPPYPTPVIFSNIVWIVYWPASIGILVIFIFYIYLKDVKTIICL